MNKEKAIVLMSGGLDCTVAISQLINLYDISALTFDYGQKALSKELIASRQICNFYKIQQKIIKLDWLQKLIKDKAEKIWIPNRNSLFLNIAATYLDNEQGGKIIIGVNKEEAQTFSDNSKMFIENINKTFKSSCDKDVEVIAPLIDMDKIEIVKLGILNNAPLERINSCYENTQKHCGKCESCIKLKSALEQNNCQNLLNKLFVL